MIKISFENILNILRHDLKLYNHIYTGRQFNTEGIIKFDVVLIYCLIFQKVFLSFI